MKIAVFGSTRGVGRALVELALAEGHEVTALARDAASLGALAHPNLRVLEGDVRDPEVVARVIAGQDAVLSTLGSPDRASTVRSHGVDNIVTAMQAAGVERLVVLSAIGVGDSREQAKRSNFVFGRIIMPLLLTKTFADFDRMEGLVRESGLRWVTVRTTGLHDKAARGTVRTVTDGSSVGSWIPRADVARFLLDQAHEPSFAQREVSIC